MLISNAENIFKAIEKRLIKIAKAYSVSDPAGEAKSWFLRLYTILKGFDEGKYEEKYLDNGELKLLTKISDPWQEEQFLKSLEKYLLLAFQRDLTIAKRKERRHVSFDVGFDEANFNASSLQPEDVYVKLMTETRGINDLVNLLEEDLKESQKLVKQARDQVNVLVLKAVLDYYKDLSKAGNFSVVSDFSAKGAEFFLDDIRDDRLKTVKKNLEDLLNKEKNNFVVGLGKKLLDDKSNSLEQRLLRYFEGMPERLKKVK